MEEKKEIKISLNNVLLIIAIAIICIMGVVIYKMYSKDNTESGQQDVTENIATNYEENNVNLQEGNEGKEENKVDNNSEDEKNEVAEELNLNDSIVQDIINKFDFETNVQASIYKVGSFNLDTIPNDLILRMGWGITNKDEEKTLNYSDELREMEKCTQTMTKEVMEKRIKSLFGTNVKYTDASFVNIETETFENYNLNKGKIVYSNNLYTASYTEGGGGILPFIHESVQKVLKYQNKVEIYVKTAFVDTDYQSDSQRYMFIVYSDFDFDNNKFQNEIIKQSEEEFYENYKSTTSLDTSNHSTINSIKNKLNTYVYTFKIDKETGEYYLDSFNKAK